MLSMKKYDHSSFSIGEQFSIHKFFWKVMMEYINFIIKKRIKSIVQIQQPVLLKYVIDLNFFVLMS